MSSLPPRSAQHVIYDNILDTIGRTPLVRLNRIARGLRCTLVAKVEFFNPGGSVKDRIALNIVEAAEREGRLKPGGTIVEGTSGNTGVGLAIVAAIKGYKTVFVMPDKMSTEKIRLLRAFGAKVVITPTAVAPDDERSYYKVSEHIVAETPNAILANQYHNPENPRSHYLTTGPEIWEQTGGHVTDVIIGMGTGGTITGAGRYLKEKNPKIRIVGVDPAGSLLYETHKLGRLPDDPRPKTYKTEGIGEDFLPTALDLSVVDEVIQVGDKETFLTTRRLVREEGIFCGGSSGTAVAAALRYCRNLDVDRFVVVLLPDSGSRYLSKIFDDDWMRENGFLESAWAGATAADVLATKKLREVITTQPGDSVGAVIEKMKTHDISQMPVLSPEGKLTGLVNEVDLLNYVVLGDKHTPDAPVAEVVRTDVATLGPDAPLESLMSLFVNRQVAVVMDNGDVVGILTKIDILDYLASHSK
ncbi:MAG TPA: cystathionine beta-synthase [Anaerolineales bacterium]|nr:cystathionine beta-synthase [Anaerolineales bacterium]